MPDFYPPSFFTHESLSRLSRDYLVIVLFVKSRSDAFPWAFEIASRAQLFAERDLDSLKLFVAGFEPTFEGATEAMDLIHYVRGWKGTHFYAQSRMIIGEMAPAFMLEAVIRCFADSCATRDYRAHCFRMIDDQGDPASVRPLDDVAPYFRHIEVKEGASLFPCKHMLQWFRAQQSHPSTIIDQIQAEGVEKLCDICPRFNPNDFRKIKWSGNL
jgi:hypothetical protein